MNWFHRICRNLGLMVHHVCHPEESSRRKVIRKEVQEEKQGDVILRRTTIEEVEIKADPPAQKHPDP